jgi:hypothetical protein
LNFGIMVYAHIYSIFVFLEIVVCKIKAHNFI